MTLPLGLAGDPGAVDLSAVLKKLLGIECGYGNRYDPESKNVPNLNLAEGWVREDRRNRSVG
jgi:hypothetical protein